MKRGKLKSARSNKDQEPSGDDLAALEHLDEVGLSNRMYLFACNLLHSAIKYNFTFCKGCYCG
jgi:hypothetical protein